MYKIKIQILWECCTHLNQYIEVYGPKHNLINKQLFFNTNYYHTVGVSCSEYRTHTLASALWQFAATRIKHAQKVCFVWCSGTLLHSDKLNSHLLAGNLEIVLAINTLYDLIVLNPILAQLDPFPGWPCLSCALWKKQYILLFRQRKQLSGLLPTLLLWNKCRNSFRFTI